MATNLKYLLSDPAKNFPMPDLRHHLLMLSSITLNHEHSLRMEEAYQEPNRKTKSYGVGRISLSCILLIQKIVLWGGNPYTS